jgi:hypothetical protein
VTGAVVPPPEPEGPLKPEGPLELEELEVPESVLEAGGNAIEPDPAGATYALAGGFE